LALLIMAAPGFAASTVLDSLPGGVHDVQFGGNAPTFAHSDHFAVSPVTAAGAGQSSSGAVVYSDFNSNGVFNSGADRILRATLAKTSILYGGGEATFSVDGSAVVTSNELTFAFGNLQETTSALHSGGDGSGTTGSVSIFDSLLGGAPAAGTGVEFTDTDAGDTIEMGSVFDLDGTYGDYNRDGSDDADGGRPTDSYGTDKDRPFLAVWEDVSPDYTPEQIPSSDADADASGVTVDNLWVGNPEAPVDITGDGNATAEADTGLTDMSGFSKLLALFVFDTDLPTGKRPFATITTIDVLSPNLSNVQIVGLNTTTLRPQSNTTATVELVGGRLYDVLCPDNRWLFTLSGQYQFDPLDGSDVRFEFEFFDTPTLRAEVERCGRTPEPTTMALFLTSTLGLAGISIRRRRK
jgi:hypothetical protein